MYIDHTARHICIYITQRVYRLHNETYMYIDHTARHIFMKITQQDILVSCIDRAYMDRKYSGHI